VSKCESIFSLSISNEPYILIPMCMCMCMSGWMGNSGRNICQYPYVWCHCVFVEQRAIQEGNASHGICESLPVRCMGKVSQSIHRCHGRKQQGWLLCIWIRLRGRMGSNDWTRNTQLRSIVGIRTQCHQTILAGITKSIYLLCTSSSS
jgi:hypothetical protein